MGDVWNFEGEFVGFYEVREGDPLGEDGLGSGLGIVDVDGLGDAETDDREIVLGGVVLGDLFGQVFGERVGSYGFGGSVAFDPLWSRVAPDYSEAAGMYDAFDTGLTGGFEEVVGAFDVDVQALPVEGIVFVIAFVPGGDGQVDDSVHAFCCTVDLIDVRNVYLLPAGIVGYFSAAQKAQFVLLLKR